MVLVNRAWMTVTGTPGTGTVTLNAARTGYLSFAAAGVADGQTVTYEISENGVGWELGRGAYASSGTTMTRAAVLITSAGNQTKLSFTSAATVFITAAAEDIEQAGSTTQAGRLELAIAAEFRTATDTARALGVKEAWDSALNSVLTDGANIAVDLAAGFNFGGSTTAKLSLGGDRSLSAPSNARGGMTGVLWFGAATSTRILTLDVAWVLMNGVEVGPYSITTAQTLGVAYITLGTTVYVTGILRVG